MPPPPPPIRTVWQDRIARAQAGPPDARGESAVPMPAAGALRDAPPDTPPDAPPATGAIDPARFAPGLRSLMDERARLERQMAALGGGHPADPRYPVAPMAERRAEFARWSAARDGGDARGAGTGGPGAGGTASPRWPADPIPQLRGTPGESLRATPGEAEPAGRVAIDPVRWNALRDTGGAISDAGRALVGRRADDARQDDKRAAGDPLDRRLARARDLADRGRAAYAAAEHTLAGARRAIPDDWAERAKQRIPGLGRADPYVRETARKLSVVVGTLEDIGEKADRLREAASAARELKAADAANDDARRDRAVERLRGRRAADGEGEDGVREARPREAERPRAAAAGDAAPRPAKPRDAAADRPRPKPRDADPPFASDRLRARREAADA